METSEDYDRRAGEADKVADSSSDPAVKQQWADLARQWRALAPAGASGVGSIGLLRCSRPAQRLRQTASTSRKTSVSCSLSVRTAFALSLYAVTIPA
jgi:hypothetical protein